MALNCFKNILWLTHGLNVKDIYFNCKQDQYIKIGKAWKLVSRNSLEQVDHKDP